MYDHIKLMLYNPFVNDTEKQLFIKRFALNVKDESKGIFHNKGHETLEQNKGIFIRYEQGTINRPKSLLTFSFSLHKFYNYNKNGSMYNYNSFNFSEANKAFLMFNSLININLDKAVVKKFEVGINVICDESPDEYLKELNRIKVQGKDMRIIEDLHYKEYKQFSTHKHKDKRIIYIFYNKTFEVRSKIKAAEKRDEIPDNILRVERDTHRPFELIYWNTLFNPVFQQLAKQEFKQRFVDDLEYKAYPVKTKGITNKQLEIIERIENEGFEGAIKAEREYLKTGRITKKQLRYFIEKAKEITEKGIKSEKQTSEKAKKVKQLIINELEKV